MGYREGPAILNDYDDGDVGHKHYVDQHGGIARSPADGTAFTVAAGNSTPAVVKDASLVSAEAFGAATFDASTGLWTIKKSGKFRVRFTAFAKGAGSGYVDLHLEKNAAGSDVGATKAYKQELTTEVYNQMVGEDVVVLAVDDTIGLYAEDGAAANVSYDGVTVAVELIKSLE